MSHPVRALLIENGGIDATHCEGPAFEALCMAERRRLGVRDDAELVRRLREDDDALHAFVAQVAVPETWFFRYPMSFEALRAKLAGRGRPVRIASIGCATGQEAYAAAATALAALGPGGSVSVEAFDRNPVAIGIARRAEWSGALALRGTVPPWAGPWIRIEAGGAWIHPHAKAAVSCTHVRSIQHLMEALDGRTFDVVMCRNLLIYLDGPTREALIASMVRAVPVGGALMLGHAERIELGPSWHRDERPESFTWHRGELPPLMPAPPGSAASRGTTDPSVQGSTPTGRGTPWRSAEQRPGTAARAPAHDQDVVSGWTQAGPIEGTTLHQQVDALMARAEAAMAARDHVLAQGLLEQVVYLAPQHDLAMLALATVLEHAGRTDDARHWRFRAQRAAARGRTGP